MMNIIVENLIKHIKSKQPDVTGRDPKKWSIMELESFAFCIQYVYKYLEEKDKEDKATLRKFYDIICEQVNSSRRGTVINSGYLNNIDKIKKANEELPS